MTTAASTQRRTGDVPRTTKALARALRASARRVTLACIATLALTATANAVNSVRIGSASGLPGEQLVLPILASFDEDIQGFSIAARWQSEVSVLPGGVIVPSLAFGGLDFTGSASNAILSMSSSFVAVESSVDLNGNASFTAAVVFDTLMLPSLPASPDSEVVVANAVFDIDPFAGPEAIQVDLSEPVGSPEVRTTLSSFAQSLLPVFQAGTVIIESEFAIRADSVQAQVGDTFPMFIRVENPSELSAFQIALTYDPDEIAITNLEDVFGNALPNVQPSAAYAGTDLQAFFATGTQPFPQVQDLQLLDLPSGDRLVVLSVILNFTPPFNQPLIPASSSQSFMRLQCEVLRSNVVVDLTNSAVSPPATNLVALADGSDISPALVDGVIFSLPASLRLQQTVVVAPNSLASVPVVATAPIDITGYSFSFSFDPTEAEIDTTASPSVWMTGTSLAFAPEDIEFFSTNLLPAALVSGSTPLDVVEVLCLFEASEPYDPELRIPSGPNRIISQIPLIIGSTFGGETSTEIALVDGFLANEIFVSGQTPFPTQFAAPQVASVDVELGGPCFIRGDIDVNGSFGIPDAIYLLSYLFTGGAKPPCLDASDVNDDESIDLSDAVGTLSFLFSGATIPGPNPTCGKDPSVGMPTDEIDCAAYPLSICPGPCP